MQKCSCAFPQKKGERATRALTIMPQQDARAAAQIPHRRTPRKINSRTAERTDIKMLTAILPRI